MLIAVIGDTHMPRGGRRLPGVCAERAAASDLIVHTGDFAELSVLRDLEALGPPVVAVAGNVDSAELRRLLPAELELELGGARFAVVHDAGSARGRVERLRRRFPTADAVLFGHSHIPLHERAPSGFQIFNPGSPTERRRSAHHTMGLAHVRDGAITFELLTLIP